LGRHPEILSAVAVRLALDDYLPAQQIEVATETIKMLIEGVHLVGVRRNLN
jgi:hypothetical protein